MVDNKILVSGMALGLDPEIDACKFCNYDLSWLFQYPSTLLWTDKIVLSPEMYSNIINPNTPNKPEKYDLVKKMIFQILESHNMLEIKKPSEIISKELADAIYLKIVLDREYLIKKGDSNLKFSPSGELPIKTYIGENEYCGQILWSIYAGILLAYSWKTNVLLTPYARTYLANVNLGMRTDIFKQESKTKISAFSELFSVLLPENNLSPSIVFDRPECGTCAKKINCEDDYLKVTENNLANILKWRDYDELNNLRVFISELSKEIEKSDEKDYSDLKRMFEEKKSNVSRKINRVFPKIERWTKVISTVSAPITVMGVATNSKLATVAGAGALGLIKVLDNFINIQKSKYKWLGFYNKNT